jgi:uncharacterized protein
MQNDADLGCVASLFRYPVKSMQGEELLEAPLGERGITGDRAWALCDAADGMIATAKNPRKWPELFRFGAELGGTDGGALDRGALRITLPDGSLLSGDAPDADAVLSRLLGRDVRLEKAGDGTASAGASQSEQYFLDVDFVDRRDTVTPFSLPEGTFFDCASVHLLTKATLARFSMLYPEGRFEVPRFRPNIVLDTGGDGFVEAGWIGKTLAIGDEVRLAILAPAGRCVMTTLPQRDLPRDVGILKTIVKENGGKVGVYGAVTRAGTVRRGDAVRLAP